MSVAIQFDPIRLPPETEVLRGEVRQFLKNEIAAGTFDPNEAERDNAEFSLNVGERGWIGMTWPKKYHRLLDEGLGNGYPSMTQIDNHYIGIVYEGSQANLVYEKITISELLK